MQAIGSRVPGIVDGVGRGPKEMQTETKNTRNPSVLFLFYRLTHLI